MNDLLCFKDLRSNLRHHWKFSELFPFEDKVTGEKGKFIGDTKPLNNTDYLSLEGESCLILSSFTERCLCNSEYSVAVWMHVKLSATSPQIFLGTSRNGTDIHGVFVYQTEATGKERKLRVEVFVDGFRWSVPFTVPQEIWFFISLSWNIHNDSLSVYLNGDEVNTTLRKRGNDEDVKRRLRLRGSFPRQEVPPSLYLESGALYDEVMTWNRTLGHNEMRRLYQAQMSKFVSVTV